MRSRFFIQNLELFKRKYISISHSKGLSAVACSDEFRVGIDIELMDRLISKNLSKKILKNNSDLNLSPIQVWTIMESSYKCHSNEKEHFTEYSFKKENNFFIRKKEKVTVKSILTIINNTSLSLSFV